MQEKSRLLLLKNPLIINYLQVRLNPLFPTLNEEFPMRYSGLNSKIDRVNSLVSYIFTKVYNTTSIT
jgi:hypothetical protein